MFIQLLHSCTLHTSASWASKMNPSIYLYAGQNRPTQPTTKNDASRQQSVHHHGMFDIQWQNIRYSIWREHRSFNVCTPYSIYLSIRMTNSVILTPSTYAVKKKHTQRTWNSRVLPATTVWQSMILYNQPRRCCSHGCATIERQRKRKICRMRKNNVLIILS